MKPNLSPTSYRVPSKRFAKTRCVWFSVSMASVSWISPPAPGAWFSRISKISGVKRYRPIIAKLLGASSAFCFSTNQLTFYNPDSNLEAISMMPYFDVSSFVLQYTQVEYFWLDSAWIIISVSLSSRERYRCS